MLPLTAAALVLGFVAGCFGLARYLVMYEMVRKMNEKLPPSRRMSPTKFDLSVCRESKALYPNNWLVLHCDLYFAASVRAFWPRFLCGSFADDIFLLSLAKNRPSSSLSYFFTSLHSVFC
jgi:hypothetical protein